MSNDRELLEKAAKAAGIALKPMEIKSVEYPGDDRFIGYMTDPDQWSRGWFNPLTDDGDALRLAAHLRLTVGDDDQSVRSMAFAYAQHLLELPHCYEPSQNDPAAAYRRAIVRAAAAMADQKEREQ